MEGLPSKYYMGRELWEKLNDPELLLLLEEKERRVRTTKAAQFFPDEGPLRRELYPKFIKFIEATKDYKELAIIAANRVGKSTLVAYMVRCFMTGLYPDWWPGHRFPCPIDVWMAGQTSQTTRDIFQLMMLGRSGEFGTGMIEEKLLTRKPTMKRSIADSVDEFYVRHVSGGTSTCGFKSYDQGVTSFYGTQKHLIALDEEPDDMIYSECGMRLMTLNGILLCTFTPLMGLSKVVQRFLPNSVFPDEEDQVDRFVIQVGWDDVPHLTDEQKEQYLKTLQPHERDARTKGVPHLGAGAIYPVPEEEITVDPFEIPPYWPHFYGMDVGSKTAVVFFSHDRQTDTLYIYDVYFREYAEPSVHADAIKSRGDWMAGVIDPACELSLMQLYYDFGLDLQKADNAVEAGTHRVYQRLSSGRLKVFSTCQEWFREYRVYRRRLRKDGQSVIVKEDDHCMDATRYGVASGIQIERVYLGEEEDAENDYDSSFSDRSSVTGY